MNLTLIVLYKTAAILKMDLASLLNTKLKMNSIISKSIKFVMLICIFTLSGNRGVE